jgi:outer membrane protein assembly factor BamA
MRLGWWQPAVQLMLVAASLPGSLAAQEPDAPPADAAQADAAEAEDPEAGGSSLIPFPVIFYQPETGFGFGASAVYYYPFSAGDTISPPSSMAPIAIYTTKKQIILGLWSEMYVDEDRWRISSGISYSKFPNKFWGIGNDTPDSAEEDYTPKTLRIKGWPQKRVADGWYAGFAAMLIDRGLSDLAEGGALESGLVPGTEDGQAVGVGGSLIRDGRDNTVYPRRGGYHQLLVDLFGKVWIGDYGYGRYTLDLRGYLPVARTHVIALQALGIATSGGPPFDQYPELGGERLLRGYFQGRYRDRDLLAFQGEYRLPVIWRFGAAGFVGIGQVAPDLGSFGFDRFWIAGGAGLRFLLAEREGLNIRADFAVGEGSTGFYLSLGEAF